MLGRRSNKKTLALGNKNMDFNYQGKRIYPVSSSQSILSPSITSGNIYNNHSNQASHQYLPLGLHNNKFQSNISKTNSLVKHR